MECTKKCLKPNMLVWLSFIYAIFLVVMAVVSAVVMLTSGIGGSSDKFSSICLLLLFFGFPGIILFCDGLLIARCKNKNETN